MTEDSTRRKWALPIVVLLGVALGGAVFVAAPALIPTTTTTTTVAALVTLAPTTTIRATTTTELVTTTTLPERSVGTVPGFTVGQPWGSVSGLTMFRGNPTRTFYGTGPLPTDPAVLWSYPGDGAMCGSSAVGGVVSQWCGSGWTGQPVVWDRPDGKTEVIFGAYDKAVHFLDSLTGAELRPSFQTGDIIKGSVTLDPDGFPLLYFGSQRQQASNRRSWTGTSPPSCGASTPTPSTGSGTTTGMATRW